MQKANKILNKVCVILFDILFFLLFIILLFKKLGLFWDGESIFKTRYLIYEKRNSGLRNAENN